VKTLKLWEVFRGIAEGEFKAEDVEVMTKGKDLPWEPFNQDGYWTPAAHEVCEFRLKAKPLELWVNVYDPDQVCLGFRTKEAAEASVKGYEEEVRQVAVKMREVIE